MEESLKRKELRHDRHTVSLLTDHLVITPKYRGKILTGEVSFITVAIISTCAEMSIKIIDIAVNTDHVHIFFLDDGTAAPFEYKFAEFKDTIFKTHKFQLVLHAIMIKENYNIDVKKGFICFTRSNNHIEEVDFTEKDFKKGIEIVNEILEIIDKGFYPGKTRYKNKCIDCCYSNICI